MTEQNSKLWNSMCYKKLILRTGMVFFSTMLLQMWSISFGFVTNQDASVVIGQVDFISDASGCSDSTIDYPTAVYTDGNRLYIADYRNHRVLIYNSIPTSNNAHADVVIGKTNMNDANLYVPSDSTFPAPNDVYAYDGKLFIVDGYCRVLIYDSIPTQNNAKADVIVGGEDCSLLSDSTLCEPHSVFVYEGKLFVADKGIHRVLIYNSIPTEGPGHADIVVGQVDMNSGDYFDCWPTSDSTLCRPVGICVDEDKLFITDTESERVLIFNSIPTQSNAHAGVVIGQVDMESDDISPPSDSTLDLPVGIWVDSTKLFIADWGNYRVLIYQPIPISDNPHADIVIGQPNMNTGQMNQGNGPGANTFGAPHSVCYANSKLFVADAMNNRCLIFDDTIVGIEEKKHIKFNKMELELTPNPFLKNVQISYILPKSQHIELGIYNVAGSLVRNLICAYKERGKYIIKWNREDNSGVRVSSGIYFCKIESRNFKTAKKLLIVY